MKMMKRGEIVDMMEDGHDLSMMRVRVRHGERHKAKPGEPPRMDDTSEMHLPKGEGFHIGQRVKMTMMMEADGESDGSHEANGMRGKIGKPKRY
jgi:hypothetical protein